MIEIYTYNAGKGDCIRIRYGTSCIHNIFIDSGVIGFGRNFAQICKVTGESLDALILTHSDSDHIGGVLSCLRCGHTLPFDEVIMNGRNSYGSNTLLSVRQNQEVYRRLTESGIPVRNAYAGAVYHIGGAELRILSPAELLMEAEEETDICRGENIQLGMHNDYGVSLDELARKPLALRDTSSTNRKSIVFTFSFEGKHLLFTGDAWSDCITDAVHERTYFDFIKMPHHGSARNISDQWPDRIECRNFLICTDGAAHPDKQTIAKLAFWYRPITVYSPSDWWSRSFMTADDHIGEYTGDITFVKKEGLILKW